MHVGPPSALNPKPHACGDPECRGTKQGHMLAHCAIYLILYFETGSYTHMQAHCTMYLIPYFEICMQCTAGGTGLTSAHCGCAECKLAEAVAEGAPAAPDPLPQTQSPLQLLQCGPASGLELQQVGQPGAAAPAPSPAAALGAETSPSPAPAAALGAEASPCLLAVDAGAPESSSAASGSGSDACRVGVGSTGIVLKQQQQQRVEPGSSGSSVTYGEVEPFR